MISILSPRAAVGARIAALLLVVGCAGGGDSVAPCSVSAIAVTPTTASVVAGASSQLSATLTATNCATAQTATWSSSNTGVATVNSTGLVTAVAPGTAIVTAANGSLSATATITVTAIPVATVAVAVPNNTVNTGQTVQATATTRDAGNNVLTGRAVAWSTSAASVATVSTSGLITALTPGTATITGTSEGQSGTVQITVIAAVAAVAVTTSANSIVVGGSATSTAVVRDAGGAVLTGRTVVWSSSNATIATVNANTGAITAVANGVANVIATVDGVVGTAPLAVVTVTEGTRFAFAWLQDAAVNMAVNTPVAATAQYATNLVGGGLTFTRLGAGRYAVRVPGLGISGTNYRENVFVSSYATAARYCSVESWDPDRGDMVATVLCYDITGTPTNSSFTILILGSNTLSSTYGFMWTPTAGPGALNPSYTFTSGVAAATYVRTSPGNFDLIFGTGAFANGSHILISTYASSPDAHCYSNGWNDGGGAGSVTCKEVVAPYASADRRFTALMLSAGRAGRRWGYAWADQSGATLNTPYSPSSPYQRISNGQAVSVTRTATGVYDLVFTGLARTGSSTPEIALVTPYGSAPGPCTIFAWTPTGANLTVTVRCFSRTDGALANSQFEVLVIE